jgi:hypothetical protein
VSLTYRLLPNDEVSYRDPPRLEFNSPHFDGVLEGGTLTLRPTQHYSHLDDARGPAERSLKAWEVDTALRLGPGAIAFEYVTGEVIDRDPPPPGSSQTIVVGAAELVLLGERVSVHVTRSKYPEPPTHFEFSPDIEVLWTRLESHRAGKEPLLSMAYFVLSWVEAMAGGRGPAAKLLSIDMPVLVKLGELTSTRGDGKSARKANRARTQRPISEAEKTWILSALKAIVRNVAERGNPNPTQVTMAGLPDL